MRVDIATLKVLLETQVGLIRNKELRGLVRRVIDQLPEAFWTREASKMYHPADERGEGGNLIHTLRVIKVADRILDTTTYSSPTRDIMKASAILHDSQRHGPDGTSRVTVKEHPQLAKALLDSLVEEQVPGIEELGNILEKHMGKFQNPSYPVSDIPLSDILHIADYLASQTDIDVKI